MLQERIQQYFEQAEDQIVADITRLVAIRSVREEALPGFPFGKGPAEALAQCHMMASDMGYLKRCLVIDFDRQARGGKGIKAFSLLKNGSNGARVSGALWVTESYSFDVVQKSGTATRFSTEDVGIETKAGRGEAYVVVVMDDFVEALKRA